jgi:dTDP-4-dehydrorhamnose reductase
LSRILLLGATGMLGHKLCLRLQGHELFATLRKPDYMLLKFKEVYGNIKLIGEVDVLKESQLEETIHKIRPDFVINCVGIVKQLKEANNAFLSVAINSYLPHKLAMLCEETGARLIHISTDCVFDGTRGSYKESDLSDAQDLYGKSKYLGETTSEESAALTLRTSIIGRELKKPTHGLVEWFLAQKGLKIKGFKRAIYTGFTTIEMARIIQMVIDKHPDLCGLYHIASSSISKYELLTLVKRIYKINVQIQPDEEFVCDRSLVMQRFSETTGYAAPSWEKMIQEMHEDPTPYETWHLNN